MLVKRDGRILECLYTFDTNVHFDGIKMALYLAPVGMSCIISTIRPGVCDQDRRPGQVNKLTPFTTNVWGLGQGWRTFLRTFAQIAGSFRSNSSACGNPSLSVTYRLVPRATGRLSRPRCPVLFVTLIRETLC